MTCVRVSQLSANYANTNAVPNSLWTWYLSAKFRTAKCNICVGQTIHHNIHSVKRQARTSTPFLIGYRPASHCQERVAFCTGRIFCPLSEQRNVYACANGCPLPYHTLASCEPWNHGAKQSKCAINTLTFPCSSFWCWACDDNAITAKTLVFYLTKGILNPALGFFWSLSCESSKV